MSEKFYIGLGHKARNGKDTFASNLHYSDPQETRVIGFADALKVYCRVEHGMTKKDAPLLQRAGLAMRESRGADIWVRVLESAANEASESVIIVPDVRFENEAAFIKAKGGVLVRVTRLLPDGSQFIADDRPADHPSEIALDGYKGWDIDVRASTVSVLKNWAWATFMSTVAPEIQKRARPLAA